VADLQALNQAVIVGDLESSQKLTRQAIDEGIDPQVIFRDALIPGMDVVGRKMNAQEYYIPEVLLSARAMKGATDILRPLLADNPAAQPVGRVVLGTVFGDLHEIGKNLVGMMLEGAGFEVTDLGTNVSPEKFVAALRDKNAHIVALSALLTTTVGRMGDVIKALDSAGLRKQVKVMIGGGAATQKFADEIGADGFSPDAAGAADLAKGWAKG
jgi:5-methyltetrahydrofolate--homocysteine methyltransferase